MSFKHLRQDDNLSHVELSGIKDSWNCVSKLAAFPSLASYMAPALSSFILSGDQLSLAALF